MVFNRILAATDFSPLAGEAIRQASEHAVSTAARLAVCHVIQNEPKTNVLFPHLAKFELLGPPYKLDQVREVLVAEVERLTGLKEEEFEVIVAEGIPHTVILDLADSWSADLIVIGSHGAEDLSDLMLGSVADAMVRQAPCSVLVVRPRRVPRKARIPA